MKLIKQSGLKHFNRMNFILLLVFTTLYGCGKSADLGSGQDLQNGIVGGVEAKGENWNAVVALTIRDTIFCSGVLVHPKVVLTAAHCLNKFNRPDQFAVYVGDGARGGKVKAQYQVESYNYHPAYIGWDKTPSIVFVFEWADIGYVVLKEEVKNVAPIKVETDYVLFNQLIQVNKTIKLAGYGKEDQAYEENDPQRYGLRRTTDSKVTYQMGFEIEIYSEGKNVSSGDSGGPVLAKVGERLVPLAINSRVTSIQNSLSNAPVNRFTQIAPYVCWIEQMSKVDITGNADCFPSKMMDYKKDIIQLLEQKAEIEEGMLYSIARELVALNIADREIIDALIKRAVTTTYLNEKAELSSTLFLIANLTAKDLTAMIPMQLESANADAMIQSLFTMKRLLLKEETMQRLLVKALEKSDIVPVNQVFYQVAADLKFAIPEVVAIVSSKVVTDVHEAEQDFLIELVRSIGKIDEAALNNLYATLADAKTSLKKKIFILDVLNIVRFDSTLVGLLIAELESSDQELKEKAENILLSQAGQMRLVMEKVFQALVEKPSENKFKLIYRIYRNKNYQKELLDFLRVVETSAANEKHKKFAKILRESFNI